MSHVRQNDATLEAQIDPAGLPYGAYYQFQVVKNTSEYPPELVCSEWGVVQPPGRSGCLIGGGTPAGAIPLRFINGSEGQSVSLDLAGVGVTLQPGTTYHYRVLAAKRLLTEDTIDWEAPSVIGPDQTFTTPPGTAPAIDSVSVSHQTPNDATLEARIDTEGLATLYQFRLWFICGGSAACLVIIDYPLPSGVLLGSFIDQSVSLDLNSAGVILHPGDTYSYSVSATSVAGTTESLAQTFIASEDTVQPLSTTTPPAPAAGQPSGLGNGDQPAGSADSTSSGVNALGDAAVKTTTRPKAPTNSHKLAKALKLCAKKPKKQRASCARQARKRYAHTTADAKGL